MKSTTFIEKVVKQSKLLGRQEFLREKLISEIVTNASVMRMYREQLKDGFMIDGTKSKKTTLLRRYHLRRIRENLQEKHFEVALAKEELREIEHRTAKLEAQLSKTISSVTAS